MKAEHHKWLAVFIIGTVVTYGLAIWLLYDRHPLLAAELVFWSPFPCPPGVPC